MPSRKRMIGLAGGIGSGKSTVARLMGDLGGYVVDADALAREALDDPDIRETIASWWPNRVLNEEGRVDRRRLADIVFESPEHRQRLEQLIHPRVGEKRRTLLAEANANPAVKFVVQDVPLLYEVGLDKECDTVVFVDADRAQRLERVRRTRGWDDMELRRREENQWPLDRKKEHADAIIHNDGDEVKCLEQVRLLLNRIFPNEFTAT